MVRPVALSRTGVILGEVEDIDTPRTGNPYESIGEYPLTVDMLAAGRTDVEIIHTLLTHIA